jgi:hypothetical protein
MVQDAIRGYVQLASGISDVTRQRAATTARQLLEQGGGMIGSAVATAGAVDWAKQVQGLADELVATSRTNRDLLIGIIRTEVERTVARLGLVGADELASMARVVERLQAQLDAAIAFTGRGGAASPSGSVRREPETFGAGGAASTAKATARKTSARKPAAPRPVKTSAASKAGSSKSARSKSAASKSAAAKSSASATSAKKAAVRRVPAKKTTTGSTGSSSPSGTTTSAPSAPTSTPQPSTPPPSPTTSAYTSAPHEPSDRSADSSHGQPARPADEANDRGHVVDLSASEPRASAIASPSGSDQPGTSS